MNEKEHLIEFRKERNSPAEYVRDKNGNIRFFSLKQAEELRDLLKTRYDSVCVRRANAVLPHKNKS